MTTPPDRWASSYGLGLLVTVLVMALVVALVASVLSASVLSASVLSAGALVALLLGGSAPPPGPAPPPPLPAPSSTAGSAPARHAAQPPNPSEPTDATRTDATMLSDPTISTAKAPLAAATQWCSLLTADDVRTFTGFEQRGSPDDSLLCTHYLAEGAGSLFVSDIPAPGGVASTVRGNSAIVYQSDPTACEVTVALNRRGEVLDIDLRGIASPRVPLCQAAVNLAAHAFDRLPAG